MLIVFAGRPGTGKTTLSRLLAAELHAAVLRIDAIEAAIVHSGLTAYPIGPVGYSIAHALAADCLVAGGVVVVDAVNPVPPARREWLDLAGAARVPLRMIEVQLDDAGEHRRRVEQRRSDLDGHAVPTWEQVAGAEYTPWEQARDGPRLLVNGAHSALALAAIRAYLAS